ncbi:PQQ-dependent sugar dehydrogenase [Aliikangiella sp. G2MR2-5]|uniref:PQQ-dependent sugar dehydrogenase n=1 Tax=Aliikangiella sp. G2MR2-5 TaxID=2788943 RepID=UPI0018AA7DF3|nr:PQQ-dependent sugar dehydrogenase [Aliikangiella sp. G2MR2-5]
MKKQQLFFRVVMSILLILNCAVLQANDKSANYQLELVHSGLTVPWGMALIDESKMLITQRSGSLLQLDLKTGLTTEIGGLPKIATIGQGGLLDIKLSPDFDKSGWLYFTYAKPVKNSAATTLARAKLINNRLSEWKDLLITKSVSTGGRHFGSRIAFDYDGHVFFSIGDRGDRDNGQNKMTHAATIVRLNLDGSIPKDNPFVDDDNALDEIWSFGHRNPQGLAFDKKTGRLWAIEHGPRGGDEINLIIKGKNYGWPVISYGKEYWGPFDVGEGTHKEGMEQPVKYYVPSIAPGSLLVYNGKAFPDWQGNLFAGALVLTHLNRVEIDNNGKAVGEERLFESLGKRVRNVIADSNGYIYFSTDSGDLYRLMPKALSN